MASRYPASEGLQVAAQPGYRNSDLDGLQPSPQEVAPSLEVATPPHSPPLEVDKRGLRVDNAEKEVRPGEGKLPAYPGPVDQEAAGSSGGAADTPGKMSIWQRHPRRVIAGAVVAVVVIVVAIVVPVAVVKSNNSHTASPLAASSGGASSSTTSSNPTITIITTASATPSSSSNSAATTNPTSSNTKTSTSSTQQPTTSSTGSSASDSSTFQAFTDTSCDGSSSTGGTANFDGTCQKAPASGALKVQKVHVGCQMTVYSDPICSVDSTLAPVGMCATANGKSVGSYSIDCSDQRPALK